MNFPFYDCINLNCIHHKIGEVSVHGIPVFFRQHSTENVSRCGSFRPDLDSPVQETDISCNFVTELEGEGVILSNIQSDVPFMCIFM